MQSDIDTLDLSHLLRRPPRRRLREWLSRLRHWWAVRQCERHGHDYEGGSYRGEYATAYWYRCRRCDEQGASE